MALDHNKITQFIRDANEMVAQLGEFVSVPEGERTEQDSGEIRRLRVVAASLVAAADAVGRMPMMPSPMMTPPPPPPPLSPQSSSAPPERIRRSS